MRYKPLSASNVERAATKEDEEMDVMNRSTKIVATIGPASSTPEVLSRMIAAGVDVVRLNFSHGKAQDHIERAEMVRAAAKAAGYYVAGIYREKASGARADRPELLRMIGDLQPGEVVIAEKIDRISRLPLPEAERLVASIQAKGARLAVPGVVDLSDLAAEAQGVAKIVLEAVQIMLFRLALQMARDDYEDRRERQRQGIELARQAGRYKGRRADPKRRAQVVALRKSGYSINKTAELAGYSAAQVKRIWAEVSQAEAKQHGAFVEDALTEVDALAAVGQDERQEERA